jgi:RHS repeat-associated protein
MRYPGQWYDSESKLHYNILRDYDPQSGRYTESDPMGLGAGLSSFSYVKGSPFIATDRTGLLPVNISVESGYRTVTGWKNSTPLENVPGTGFVPSTGPNTRGRTTIGWNTPTVTCNKKDGIWNVSVAVAVYFTVYLESSANAKTTRDENDHVNDYNSWAGKDRGSRPWITNRLQADLEGECAYGGETGTWPDANECVNAMNAQISAALRSSATNANNASALHFDHGLHNNTESSGWSTSY